MQLQKNLTISIGVPLMTNSSTWAVAWTEVKDPWTIISDL